MFTIRMQKLTNFPPATDHYFVTFQKVANVLSEGFTYVRVKVIKKTVSRVSHKSDLVNYSTSSLPQAALPLRTF
jgi:hypothetical protein